MKKQILILGDETLVSLVEPLELEVARADDLDGVVEEVKQSSVECPVALVDLRVVSDDAEHVVESLLDAAPRPLPVVAIVGAGDVENAVVLQRLGVLCLHDGWVAFEGGEAVRLALESALQGSQRTSILRDYEKRYEQLLQTEKFAAVGLLAAEIAHEINNPATFVITNLTVMMDYVDTIADFHRSLRSRVQSDALTAAELDQLERDHEISFLEEDLESLLDRSLAGLDRIHQIVQDLRFFSGERRSQPGWVDVAGLVRAATNLVRHEARFRARLVIELPDLPRVHTDPNRLSQVLLNLIVNAVQAIPAGEADENEVRVSGWSKGGTVTLAISDTGPGIADEDLPHVFEAFYTTKPPGEGTGLGLAISKDVMLGLGGTITVDTRVGSGTTFFVSLPIERDPPDE